MNLNPNCSEFTFRIKISDLDKKQIKLIKETFEDFDKASEAFDGIDIYFGKEKIFGIDHFKLTGDAGDHGCSLATWLEGHDITFESDEQ